MRIGDTLRYSRSPSVDYNFGGYVNFKYFGRSPHPGQGQVILESGINATAVVRASDGPRRPLVAIRSSPWKAGSETTPWHDEIDLDHGHIRYFGDHKVTTIGPLGSTRGNAALVDAFRRHSSPDRLERLEAEPLVVFLARPVYVDGRRIDKGHLDFAGVAIIERLEYIVQRDPKSGRSFPNLALDLNIISLDANDELDWRWIDDRRDANLTGNETLRYAPASWRRWVNDGRVALPGIRRRVQSSRVLGARDQLPQSGSSQERTLTEVYRFFDGKKHAFESLAAKVAAEVIGLHGGYTTGWLTRAGGDGGMDFVARLDVGSGAGSAPLVILGQAKCVAPNTGISPDQVARVVARLRRGWVGVYVTTGYFSRQAQVEIVDDEYPVVLVSGGRLAEVVERLVQQSAAGDLHAFLQAAADDYADSVAHRRPSEITTIA